MEKDVHGFLRDLMRLCGKYDTMLTGAVFDFPNYELDIVRCCDKEVTGNKIERAKAEGFKVEADG